MIFQINSLHFYIVINNIFNYKAYKKIYAFFATKAEQKMKVRLISKSLNGQILLCPCNKITIEFGNLQLHLDFKDFKAFKDYLDDIDADFYEGRNNSSPFKRKISVPLFSTKYMMAFSAEEIKELIQLMENAMASVKINDKGIRSDYSLN